MHELSASRNSQKSRIPLSNTKSCSTEITPGHFRLSASDSGLYTQLTLVSAAYFHFYLGSVVLAQRRLFNDAQSENY